MPVDRLCPDCHMALTPRAYHGVSLDVCAHCGGVWFDGGGAEALRAAAPRALLDVEASAAPEVSSRPHVNTDRWCPACPQPLARFAYETGAPIEVDCCPKCHGMWVEDGELARMQAWVEQQRRPRFAPEPARSADDMALAVAEFTREHEEFMARAHALTTFFGFMARRRWPSGGWW